MDCVGKGSGHLEGIVHIVKCSMERETGKGSMDVKSVEKCLQPPVGSLLTSVHIHKRRDFIVTCKKSFKHKYYLQKHSCLVERL